jgi:hypothetical protein
MKNYATQTDIITTPDAIYAPGGLVKYQGELYIAESFSWDDWNKTWTYCLLHPTWGEWAVAVPESELSCNSHKGAKLLNST